MIENEDEWYGEWQEYNSVFGRPLGDTKARITVELTTPDGREVKAVMSGHLADYGTLYETKLATFNEAVIKTYVRHGMRLALRNIEKTETYLDGRRLSI